MNIRIRALWGSHVQMIPGYISRNRIAGHRICIPQTALQSDYKQLFSSLNKTWRIRPGNKVVDSRTALFEVGTAVPGLGFLCTVLCWCFLVGLTHLVLQHSICLYILYVVLEDNEFQRFPIPRARRGPEFLTPQRASLLRIILSWKPKILLLKQVFP